MPTLSVKAYRYVFPVKATITVVDDAFRAKGDINRDGVIDVTDQDLLKVAWWSKPGDPNWNPDADLNGDGRVDARDLGILGLNWGSLAPEYATPFTTEVAVGKCVLYGRYKAQTLKAVAEMAEANTKKVTFIFMTVYAKSWIR